MSVPGHTVPAGMSAGYRYAHAEEGGVARGETYLPEELEGLRFYEPTGRGYEKTCAFTCPSSCEISRCENSDTRIRPKLPLTGTG